MPEGGVRIDDGDVLLTAVVDEGIPFLVLRIGDCMYDLSCTPGIMSDARVQRAIEIERKNQEVAR